MSTRTTNQSAPEAGIARRPSVIELVGYLVLVAIAFGVRAWHQPAWLVIPLVALVLVWHQVARRAFPNTTKN